MLQIHVNFDVKTRFNYTQVTEPFLAKELMGVKKSHALVADGQKSFYIGIIKEKDNLAI